MNWLNDLAKEISETAVVVGYKEMIKKFKASKTAEFYSAYLAKPVHFISKLVSWTTFLILIICAAFLIYYYVSLRTYATKGAGYEPKYELLTIISGSMEPTILVYDVIITARQDGPEDIEVGDVISYNSTSFRQGESISVTHRVIEVIESNGTYAYVTKGDNNFIQDPNTVSFDQITGEVIFKIPQLGRIQFFLASAAGWLLVIVLPALFILAKYVIQLLNLASMDDKTFNKLEKEKKKTDNASIKNTLPEKCNKYKRKTPRRKNQ